MTIQTSPEVAQKAIELIDKLTKDPGTYWLVGNNCTDACENILRELGLYGGDVFTPDDFWDRVSEKYGNKPHVVPGTGARIYPYAPGKEFGIRGSRESTMCGFCSTCLSPSEMLLLQRLLPRRKTMKSMSIFDTTSPRTPEVRGMNKRLLSVLGSVGLSSAVLSYWLGLGVGANRFGDVAAHNTTMRVLIPTFFGFAALTAWLVHSLLEEWLLAHSKAAAVRLIGCQLASESLGS